MNAGEFAVIDNAGYVQTDLKNLQKAKKAVKDLKKDPNFHNGGRLAIVKVIGTYDSFIAGSQEHLGADGLPIED